MASSDCDLVQLGVQVQRSACPADAAALCHAEMLAQLAAMLALPAAMTARATGRHFLPFSLSRSFAAPKRSPEHRRDFVLPLSDSVRAVLTHVLSGSAGDVLARAVGADAERCGLSAIVSDPGAAAQDVHSDAEWSADGPRLVTAFLALHDVLEEELGPTRFIPQTHAPSCFPDGSWVPPTERRVADRGGSTWFQLHAGDCVLMESTTWHAEG